MLFLTAIFLQKRGGDTYKVCPKCFQGGSYQPRSLNTLIYSTTTRLPECPLKLYGSLTKKNSTKWRLVVKNITHNHPALEDYFAHPAERRLTETQKEKLEEMITIEASS
jgi:hypothetical protein